MDYVAWMLEQVHCAKAVALCLLGQNAVALHYAPLIVIAVTN